ELTLDKKRFLVDSLLSIQSGETFPRGSVTNIAKELGVHKSTISRIFSDANKQRDSGKGIDVRSKKIGRKVGRKPKAYDEAWLQSTPLHLRTTIRSFSGCRNMGDKGTTKHLKRGHKGHAHHKSLSINQTEVATEYAKGHMCAMGQC
ncbi:Conotoxin Cal1.1a, partial [Bienertia sinuspersici]